MKTLIGISANQKEQYDHYNYIRLLKLINYLPTLQMKASVGCQKI